MRTDHAKVPGELMTDDMTLATRNLDIPATYKAPLRLCRVWGMLGRLIRHFLAATRHHAHLTANTTEGAGT